MSLFVALIALLSSTGIFVLINPRLRYRYTLKPVNLPDDLEQYLHDNESCQMDICEGAEKQIIWADSNRKEKTPISIVYLHGFTATRQETAPLPDNVAKTLGANLFYTRLTGHGQSGEALAAATVQDWLNDAVEALEIGQRLGDKVVLMGTSTGATLAVWLAGKADVQNVAALVLISPNFWVKDRRSFTLLLPWAHQLVKRMIGPTVYGRSLNEQHARYWTQTYPIGALLPLMGVVYLMRSINFKGIQTPLLIVYSPVDQVVSVAAIKKLFPRFGSPNKRLIAVDGGTQDPMTHVIAGDILAPQNNSKLEQDIVDFLKPLI